MSILATEKKWTALNKFVQQLRQWAKDQGWNVEEEAYEIGSKDQFIETQRLEITTNTQAIVRVEPKGIGILDKTLRVEVVAWPSLNRVTLIGEAKANDWKVLTDSGINLPDPVNSSQTFSSLVSHLTAS